MPDPTATEPEVVTPPDTSTQSAPDNMLKALGYFTEPATQEQVPNPDAGETETPAAEGETETPASTETETPSTETPEGEPAKPAAKPVIPKEQRANKVKPSDVLTKEAIADAVREGLTTKREEAATVDPLAKYGDLLPQEKRALELAQFAARTRPDKYKDMEAKEVNFITKNREYIQSVVNEKGTWTAEDAQSDEYQKLLRQHKPTYQHGDKEDLLIERGVEKGLTAAEKRFKGELEARDRKMAEMEVRPQITKVLSTIEDDILSVLDKDTAAAVKANPVKAADESGIDASIAVAVIADTQATASEYLRLSKDAKEFDSTNPIHTKLVSFIQNQGRFLEQMPEDKRQREGKTLVSRERWATIPKEQKPNYCTFSDGDVLDMLAVSGRNYVTAAVKSAHERIAKSGYERRGATAPAKPAAPAAAPVVEKPAAAATPPPKPAAKPATSQPPKGGVSATPGAGAGAKPIVKEQLNPALAALGYGNLPATS